VTLSKFHTEELQLWGDLLTSVIWRLCSVHVKW